MAWEQTAIIIFGVVFVFLLSGTPVAVSLGLVGIFTAYIFLGGTAALGYACWNICTQFILIAIPLFIFMGQVLLYSGLSSRLYDGTAALLGPLPGSLLHVNIGSSAVFAAITGSSVATSATIGTIAIPDQMKRGYQSKILFGSLAAGGTLGGIIPPSLGLIVYGAMCGLSIGKLFIAGIFPGIMLAILFMGYILVRVIMQPQLAPTYEKIPLRLKLLSIMSIWPLVVIIFIVLGGIYLGVVTPTEASAVGSVMTLVFALAYRKLTWQNLKASLRGTVKTTTMIMFLIIGAQILSATLNLLRVPDNAIAWVTSLPISPLLVMISFYLMYLGLGCFMDGFSIMMVTLPIIFPIIVALGFDPIWFGVVGVELTLEMGLITPPVGLNVYVIHGLCPDRPMSEVFIGVIPFFIVMLVALAILTAFPEIVTFLPSTMG